MSDSIYVIGAGGHAKVVIRAIVESGQRIAGIFDDRADLQGTVVLGFPVIGFTKEVTQHREQPSILAIGDNGIRRSIVRKLDIPWATVVHPSAIIDSTVNVGVGVVVMAGAVVQADSVIGAHAIVNTAASVDHDCVLGEFSHVSPGAHLAGECRLGEGGLVGVGASVIPQVQIGEWSVVGAGAAVIGEVPANHIAVGVPARSKSLRESDS